MSNFKYRMTSVSKLLEQISGLKKKEERVQALRENAHPVMSNILKYMFDPNIKFLLPEGKPPFRPNQYDEPKALLQEAHKMYLFIEGGNPNLKPIRREQLFIQILEIVTKEDADLLVAMKDKKSPYKGITYDIVKTAYPELLP